MGSPYMHFALNRVNVVRSAPGFVRLSNEILTITGSFELRGLALVAEHAIRLTLLNREEQLHYETFDAISAAKTRPEALQEYFWDLVHRSEVWTPMSQAYIDLSCTGVCAALHRSRVVAAIATSYETSETRHLDRAVVFDFTKKGT